MRKDRVKQLAIGFCLVLGLSSSTSLAKNTGRKQLERNKSGFSEGLMSDCNYNSQPTHEWI